MKHLHRYKIILCSVSLFFLLSNCSRQDDEGFVDNSLISVKLVGTQSAYSEVNLEILDVEFRIKEDETDLNAWISLSAINTGVHNITKFKSNQVLTLVDFKEVPSDFIYAIIIEEYGMIGGLVLMLLYLWLLFRIVIVAQKADSDFGKLLAIGVGLPIVFQALINMAVAVELFPVTGQTLPLISSGGTSIWMTCLAIGIILSVSAKRQEIIEQENQDENPLEILSETI